MDPPPPPTIIDAITTQPSIFHSPHRYNTPPPTLPITTQPSLSQIHTTLPPIPLSFNNTITTQPQSHYSQTYFPPCLSSTNSNPPSSLPITQNPLSLPPSISNTPSTSYDPYASLHPGFHNYPLSFFFNLLTSLLTLFHHPLLRSFSTHLQLNLLLQLFK